MEQLIEMAKRLGKQIAEHQRTVLLKKAQKEVDNDTQAGQLVLEYQQNIEKIQKLEKEQKPIEVQDKQELKDIELKIAGNDKLKEVTLCQMNFVEMMQKIKQAIYEQLELDKA